MWRRASTSALWSFGSSTGSCCAVGGGGRSGWTGVEVYMKPGGGCGGMLTFGLSATAGEGRVAGLRTGPGRWAGGEGLGCGPPEESEEVLAKGGEPDE